jgi:hypothetical protein
MSYKLMTLPKVSKPKFILFENYLIEKKIKILLTPFPFLFGIASL